MSNPTAQEQEFLELINRMRLTPNAELELLLNSRDPTIKASIDRALTTFSTNLVTLRSQWVDLQAAAPLAWSSELNNAAIAHNQEMIRTNSQTHRTAGEKKLADRLTDAGYVSNSRAENVYAYAQSVFYAQAAFAIDWGDINSIDGIQSNAGHRAVLLSPDVREVGVAVTAENNPNTRVGPLVVTQDFGSRDELIDKAYILGVAFTDKNRDTWYEAGEGIKDIQIKITGVNGTNFSDTFAVTDTGGYQKLLDAGRYQVDFIRNGNVLGRRIASIESTAPQNIKLDLVLPVVQLGSLQNAATGNNTLDFRTDTDLNGVKTSLNGKKIDISFTNVSADAAYHNYGGIYRVEDNAGTVINPVNGIGYKPGDTGYIEAALRRSLVANNGQVQLDNQSTSRSTQFKLDGGYQYATFIVADGSIDQVLSASDPSKAPRVYFNHVAANADGKQHFQSVGNNAFAVEDTFNLTNTDYNDLIFQVNAKVS